MSQIVSCTFFTFSGAKAKWWAFKQMRLAHDLLTKIGGLRFYKLMGTGGGDGFQVRPDLSSYCLLGVWENQKIAEDFFEQSEFMDQYEQRSDEKWTLWMKAIHAHGKWSGQQPFEFVEQDETLPVAIITRASIRKNRMLDFWLNVRGASKDVKKAKGQLFAKGIGEWPLVEQATFSIWDSIESVKNYAYQQKAHKTIVRKTRERGWYSEEMFARFQIVRTEGSWKGNNPLMLSALWI